MLLVSVVSAGSEVRLEIRMKEMHPNNAEKAGDRSGSGSGIKDSVHLSPPPHPPPLPLSLLSLFLVSRFLLWHGGVEREGEGQLQYGQSLY